MGKTAAVEGLAQRIVAGDVPVALMGVKILELDLGSLSAGCMMPGRSWLGASTPLGAAPIISLNCFSFHLLALFLTHCLIIICFLRRV